MSRITVFLSIWIIAILSGCSSDRIALDSKTHTALIQEDLAQLKEKKLPLPEEITLDQAISRGIVHNFDARLAAFNYLAQQDQITLAKLSALPSLEVSGKRLGRSNEGASSSKSAIDGDISLEPSFSTEPNRNILDLEAKWDLTEAALAFVDAKTQTNRQKVLKVRSNKVKNGIARDVYAAYWKAYAHQTSSKKTKALIEDLKAHIKDLDTVKNRKLISLESYIRKKRICAKPRRSYLSKAKS